MQTFFEKSIIMLNQAEASSRVPPLSQANLNRIPQNRYVSRQSMHSSQSGNVDTLGSLPNLGNQRLLSMSKRNSVSSTIDHYSHNFYQPGHKVENTYSLGPNDNQKFNSAKVQKLVRDILNSSFENVKYEPNKCKDQVQLISDEIKTRIKSIVYKRYKIVVSLTIGQNTGNSIIIASRSLWNTETDNECTITYKNSTLYAIASIFATYFD